MFVSIKERLDLLVDVQKQIQSDMIKFDPNQTNFGFRRMEQLYPVGKDEIKGYPCKASNRFSDPVMFGIKVIPLENKFDDIETHPCHIETELLKEFTNLVVENVTPHMTFYFDDMSVGNKKRALTRFPLKSLEEEIFKECKVLIAEYVPGGSIEEWIQEQPNISENQWKYIIFSMAWTLHVLQTQYHFLHNDFHFGNVLIDTSIDPRDKSYYQYLLKQEVGEDGKKTEDIKFNIQNVGLLPKLWDLEFSTTFAWEKAKKNDFFRRGDDNIPTEFNPYYDLHCFLTSLLDLDYIPEKTREFIHSLYPEEVLPPVAEYDSEFDSINTSEYESDYDSEDSFESEYDYAPDEYYRTDETTMESRESNSSRKQSIKSSASVKDTELSSTEEERDSQTNCTKRSYDSSISSTSSITRRKSYDSSISSKSSKSCNSSISSESSKSYNSSKSEISRNSTRRKYDESENDDETKSETESGWSVCSDGSQIRTEFMLGDRMLNGTEKKFNLPTPKDILLHTYFADYRKPLNKKKLAHVFTFDETEASKKRNERTCEYANVSKKIKLDEKVIEREKTI